MIPKEIKLTNPTRVKRAIAGGLFDYVLARKDEDGKHKRDGSSALNFIAVTGKGHKAEMPSLSEESIKKAHAIS